MVSISMAFSLAKLWRHPWNSVLGLRPTFALAAVWLTTAGHTMTFREMDAARGWVTTEGYSLHSIYLIAIALTLLAAPRAAARFGSYPLVVAGLLMLVAGALINGLLLAAPLGVLEVGRVVAGIGAGLVIREAPRIQAPDWKSHTAWAGIILPPAGPVVIAGASYAAGLSTWQEGFLFEGILAGLALAAVLSIAEPSEPATSPVASTAYWPVLAVGSLATWYVFHWGQLHGWLEAADIVGALIVMGLALSGVVWIAWPEVDWGALRDATPRLLLVTYGGFVQYFNASDMGVYGGLLVNFSPWMRAWLIVSLSIGAATALAVGRIVWSGRSPGFGGAIFGLLVLASGMAISHETTLNWPFWQLLNSVEFNWFAAPQHWQLAPPRFLMGFGSAMVLLAMTGHANRDPEREAKIRPFVEVAQFGGGALSIGVLVVVLLVGHQVLYSYSADRDFIQSAEIFERGQVLTTALTHVGSPAAARQSQTLLYRSVNYEADNLIFAAIYAGFFVASVLIAALCIFGLVVDFRSMHADQSQADRR